MSKKKKTDTTTNLRRLREQNQNLNHDSIIKHFFIFSSILFTLFACFIFEGISHKYRHGSGKIGNSGRSDLEIRNTESLKKTATTLLHANATSSFVPKWSKILEEESKVHVLEESFLKTHCSSCFKDDLKASVSCTKCNAIHYCDDSCRSNDLEYHKQECTLKELTGVLPSISIRLFLRFLHHFTITPAKLAFPFHDNNDDEHLDEDLRLIFTKEIEYLKHHLPNIDVSTETLVKYRRFLKSNSFLMRKQDTGGGGGEVFGSQYIESHARVKNSCQPNCISSYNGRSAYLIAIRDINPEEEITICYTNTALDRSARQLILKNSWNFECRCGLCSSNEFELPEAYRTARRCSCGKLILDNATLCSECSTEVFDFSSSDLNDLLTKFYSLPSIDKFNVFKMLHSSLHEAHWIINKMADNLIHEFCTDSEYIREMPGLLVDLQTGRVRGDQTISNPFTIIARLEYVISLLSRDSQTIPTAQAIFPVYLQIASRLKGVNDEYLSKLIQLYTQWNEKYGPTPIKLIQ